MTTETEMQAKPIETEAVDDGSMLASALSRLVLASIGAFSLAEETAEHLLQRLVERGDLEMQHAHAALEELRTRRPHLPRPPHPVIAIGTERLASKADIEALQEQLAGLSAEVAQLSQRTRDGV